MEDATKPATFLGLPVEIRSQILTYILPYWTFTDCILEHTGGEPSELYDSSLSPSKPRLCPLGGRPTKGILTVNKQMHAEAVAILTLHAKGAHRITISENTFRFPRAEDIALTDEGGWSWDLGCVFPGIDLSKVKKLIIRIQPSDFPVFWADLLSLLTQLCEHRLLAEAPLPKMTIQLDDMIQSWGWSDSYFLPIGPYYSGQYDGMMAQFCDFQAALEPFFALRGHTAAVEVHLPYWTEFAEGMPKLSQRLIEEMRGSVVFTPAEAGPYFVGDMQNNYGLPIRSRKLAPVAEADYHRAQAGMLERLVACGRYE